MLADTLLLSDRFGGNEIIEPTPTMQCSGTLKILGAATHVVLVLLGTVQYVEGRNWE
jgi:hypothetical protein